MDDYQLSEIGKCADNPLYFINNYCQIVSLNDGVVLFKTFDYQNEFIELVNNNRFVISKQARQCGKSTICAAYILWYVLFCSEKRNAAISSNEMKGAVEILDRIKDMYELLPDWMRSKPKCWNKRKIQFSNGSCVIAGSATKAGLRSLTISLLLIDELAWIDKSKWNAFYTSSFSTVTSGKKTKIIAISTPNGENHFAELYRNAESGKSGWKHLSVDWTRHPDRDEEWKRVTLAGMTGDKNRQFAQEHAVEFLGSSATLLSADILSILAPAPKLKSSETISIFENPLQNEKYVISVDCSEGIAEDSQSFSVIKIIKDGKYFKGDQVATFDDNNMSPDQLPYILAEYGRLYNNAYILLELASTGPEVAKILFEEIEYENIVMVTNTRGSEQFGIVPTTKTKRIGCAEFKSLVESSSLNIRCDKTLEQLRRFIRVNKSYAADKGYHDDLVMTLVNFSYMTKQEDFKSNILDFLQKKQTTSNDFILPDVVYTPQPVVENKRPVNYGNGTFYIGKLQDLDASDLAAFMG